METKLNKIDNIKNISSQECFEKLSIEVHSHLIDVRTKPEWVYVCLLYTSPSPRDRG